MFEPDDLNIVFVGFLNGEMDHGVSGVGAMPVAFAGFDPHRIAWANLLNWLACQLNAANSGQDVQSLTHGMSVPGGARGRLERDAIHFESRGRGSGGDFIDPHRSGEPGFRAFTATAYGIGEYFQFSTP